MLLRDLLVERRVPLAPQGHHHVTPGRLQVDCPICTPGQSRWRLGIAENGHYASCWTCGRLPLVETLAAVLSMSFSEIRQRLHVLDEPTRREKVVRGTLKVPKGIGDLMRIHRRYLEDRGFDPDEIAETWGVRGIGVASRLSWRLFIPAMLNGEIVSWTTRSLADRSTAKYVSAKPDEEKIGLKELLYGQDMTRHVVCVVEGPIDAWAIGPGAVATCGVVLSREQKLLIAQYPLRVICMDADKAGQRRASHLVQELSVFPGRTLNVVLDTGKDAASASKKEVRQVKNLLV